MKTYLEMWTESLVSGPSLPLTKIISVKGIRKAHLGPRLDLAQVSFVVEPAESFNAVVRLPNLAINAEQQSLIEWAIYGFLDIVMMTAPYPTKNIKLTVVEAEFDPVSSTNVGYRLAGRDAGRKFIEELRPATKGG